MISFEREFLFGLQVIRAMMTARVFWCVAFFSLASPAWVPAQSTTGLDPFRVLSSTSSCQSRQGSADDPGPSATVLQFSEGEELVDERILEAGYDRTGRPLWLMMLADQSVGAAAAGAGSGRAWSVVMHGYFVSFTPDGAAHGFHKPGLRERDPRPVAAGVGRPLSAEATASARVLTLWLWKHRCGVSYSLR